MSADGEGALLPVGTAGRCQAVFDGTTIWTFEPDKLRPMQTRGEGDEERMFVPWPPNMRQWLTGRTHLVIRTPDGELDAGEVAFDDEPHRVTFVDENGLPVVIDKWGLAQRPFASRAPETTAAMADTAAEIIELVRREHGLELWMAFGTLLGAVRSGRVIEHDADMDLAYLSSQPTPARMAQELFAVRRTLARHGYRVVNKSGSFLTVAFTAPDGGLASIDIYTTFYLSGLLHETATVRARVPRSALLPLRELEFEGRLLPAPADPDTLLAASYGPSWREPDPDFVHEPGPEIVGRFDGWFGTPMQERRQWEAYWRDLWRPEHDDDQGFRDWVEGLLPEGAGLVDIGAGRGDDAVYFGRQGRRVAALDYARRYGAALVEAGLDPALVTRHLCNLYDTRDALSQAALLARRMPDRRVVLARHLLDAVSPRGRKNVWWFARIILAGGGDMLVEVDERAPDGTLPRFAGVAGRRFPLSLDQLEREWTAAGATETHREQVPTPPDVPAGTTRWRIILTWPAARPPAGHP